MRSLILAGGGVKVAFQAGVLQVWLDEAGLTFDHADGASGGTFNLAMWCQGMSGADIADAWRRTKPVDGVSFNTPQLMHLPWARSLFTLDAYRRNVFPTWGLDWPTIRGSARNGTFNLYNFTKHELIVAAPAEMDEDRLCACVSLPMWFPPVRIDRDDYIDAVFVTDANIEESIRRGADDIWVIWTVSMRGSWNDGFVANYFQIIEAAANGRFNAIRKRIESNNAAIARGERGEFGRPIALKVLQAEVPIHYLVNFSQDRLVDCVNLGVEAAREWCRREGIPLSAPRPAPAPPPAPPVVSVAFSEEMKGSLAEGAQTPAPAQLHVDIAIDDLDRFIREPAHQASASGWLEFAPLGGRLPIERGTFNLFVDDGDPHRKHMRYRLFLRASDGRRFTLAGVKDISDEAGNDIWSDTTTLHARVLAGWVEPADDVEAAVLAAGIVRVGHLDFLAELGRFKVRGASAGERAAGIARFGAFFLGSLWDVYATHFLSYAPI